MRMWWQKKSAGVAMIFRWRQPRLLSFRLVFFLLVALVVHLAAFYVFEVVYPPNRRDLMKSGTIWLLSSDNPDVRAVLSRHEASLRAFSGGGGRLAGEELALVPLRLSFDGYVPWFEPLPAMSPAGKSGAGDDVPRVLPPVPPMPEVSGTGNAPAVPPPQTLVWVGPDGQESAGVPPAELAAMATGTAAWKFQVAYGADRRVREAVLVQGLGGAIDGRVRRAVLALQVPEALPVPASGGLAWVNLNLNL